MRSTKKLVPIEVTETVAVAPVPRYSEQSSVSFVDFYTMKRFNEEVTFNPVLTPVAYRDTIICHKNCTKKNFKSETRYEPRVKPRNFSDTLIMFPKKPQKGYVTFLDYHMEECKRWFKTTMEFKARTFTTRKCIRDGDKDGETGGRDVNDNIPGGPGASQIYLPRWEHDGCQQTDTDRLNQQVLNAQILVNGY